MIRHGFVDPVRDSPCALVIPDDGRLFREPKIGIAHPNCDTLADLSIELDAFYCPACAWNGRVSGAWCAEMINIERGWPSASDEVDGAQQ